MKILNIVLFGKSDTVVVNLKYDKHDERHNASVSLDVINNIKSMDEVKNKGTFTIAYSDGSTFTYPASTDDEIIKSIIADANENGCRNREIKLEDVPDLFSVKLLCTECFNPDFQDTVVITENNEVKVFEGEREKACYRPDCELPDGCLKQICAIVHTPEIKAAYAAKILAETQRIEALEAK